MSDEKNEKQNPPAEKNIEAKKGNSENSSFDDPRRQNENAESNSVDWNAFQRKSMNKEPSRTRDGHRKQSHDIPAQKWDNNMRDDSREQDRYIPSHLKRPEDDKSSHNREHGNNMPTHIRQKYDDDLPVYHERDKDMSVQSRRHHDNYRRNDDDMPFQRRQDNTRRYDMPAHIRKMAIEERESDCGRMGQLGRNNSNGRDLEFENGQRGAAESSRNDRRGAAESSRNDRRGAAESSRNDRRDEERSGPSRGGNRFNEEDSKLYNNTSGYRSSQGYRNNNEGRDAYTDRGGHIEDRGHGGQSRDENYNDKCCFSCGGLGHFSRECQRGMQVRMGRSDPYAPVEEDEEELFKQIISTGINFDQYEKITATVSGDNPPHKISAFSEAGLNTLLLDNIKRCGYKKPTPVQKNAIPIIKEGRDLMACAQTGSGKTGAFLLPILHRLLNERFEQIQGLKVIQPLVCIVVPTRELADQIKNQVRMYSSGSGLKCVEVVGGQSVRHVKSRLSRGAHVIVATPGRLLMLIDEGFINFRKLRTFVLDEADRMLDLGFMPDIERLESHESMPPRSRKQTLMFSATFPEEIQKAATDFLKQDYLFLQVGLLGSACADVAQYFVKVPKFDKRSKLMSILNEVEQAEKTLIFVETKQSADYLATYLSQSDFKATSVHGDRFQEQRDEAVNDFKHGRMPLLVATAVAARGLDIPHISHVINFDLPATIDEYVHRIGRTGRVGNRGKATSFYDPEKDFALASDLVRTLAEVLQTVPNWLQTEARRGQPFANDPQKNRDIRSKPSFKYIDDKMVDEDDNWY